MKLLRKLNAQGWNWFLKCFYYAYIPVVLYLGLSTVDLKMIMSQMAGKWHLNEHIPYSFTLIII